MNWRIKVSTIYSLLIFFSNTVNSQDNSKWVNGQITFKDGKEITAMIKELHVLTEGLILIKISDNELIYTPEKVYKYSYFDEPRKVVRKFESIPLYVDNGTRAKRIFLEITFIGDRISLFRRTYLSQKFVNRPASGPGSIKVEVLYLYNSSNNLIKPFTDPSLYRSTSIKYINTRRKLFYKSICADKREVKKFKKENNLKFNDISDLLKIFEFSESLLRNVSAANIGQINALRAIAGKMYSNNSAQLTTFNLVDRYTGVTPPTSLDLNRWL